MSFSISSSDIDDEPYALFGGYNSSQILHQEAGIATFKNAPGNFKLAFKSWALSMRDFRYGNQTLAYNG